MVKKPTCISAVCSIGLVIKGLRNGPINIKYIKAPHKAQSVHRHRLHHPLSLTKEAVIEQITEMCVGFLSFYSMGIQTRALRPKT